MKIDTYRSYSELAAHKKEAMDFQIRHRALEDTDLLVLTPHGGKIEPGTSELTKAIAGQEASMYSFEGIMPRDNRRLHLTSTLFDEPICLRLLQAAQRVLAIHGQGSPRRQIFLGGLDKDTREKLDHTLKSYGFPIKPLTIPGLRGCRTKNICNRGCSGAGVQLEISNGLRATFFSSLTSEGLTQTTPEFDRFVTAVRQAVL
ncbi:MAG: poly-gamma-glutamate hydrolase family protein [Thermodesulfobacteriota bacterium]